MILVDAGVEGSENHRVYNYTVDFEGKTYTVKDLYDEFSKRIKSPYTRIIGCNVCSEHGDIPLFDFESDENGFLIIDTDYFNSIEDRVIKSATAAVIGFYEYYYLTLEEENAEK